MSDQITVSLPGYQWEAILRGLASSGWDSMHAMLSEKLASSVVAEEPEWEYRYAEIYDGGEMYTYGPKGDPDRSFATSDAADGARIDDTDIVVRRRKAGPWVPVEQGGGS